MNITVLGCGALGQIWLSALSRQGHQVQGWLRVPRPSIRVQINSPDGLIHRHQFSANDAGQLANCQLLLVTLKAAQISAAIEQILPLLPAECPILLIHNGMGVLDELPVIHQPLLRGITTHSSYRERDRVIHVAHGLTHIGPVNRQDTRFSLLADKLHEALPDVAWHDNILPACWNKLAINCVINPLSVRYDCQNGDILAYPQDIAQICQEVAEVMARENLHADAARLQANALHVLQLSAANTSSMLQDLRAGRSSENDYITGYLLRTATRYGMSLPFNRELYQFVKNKESANGHPEIRTGLPSTWQ